MDQTNYSKQFLYKAREVWTRAIMNPYGAFNHLLLDVQNLDQTEKYFRDIYDAQPIRLLKNEPTFDKDKLVSVFWQSDCFWELSEAPDISGVQFTIGDKPIGHMREAGYFIEDIEKEIDRLISKGWIVHSRNTFQGWKAVYVRPIKPNGLMTELIQICNEDD